MTPVSLTEHSEDDSLPDFWHAQAAQMARQHHLKDCPMKIQLESRFLQINSDEGQGDDLATEVSVADGNTYQQF